MSTLQLILIKSTLDSFNYYYSLFKKHRHEGKEQSISKDMVRINSMTMNFLNFLQFLWYHNKLPCYVDTEIGLFLEKRREEGFGLDQDI